MGARAVAGERMILDVSHRTSYAYAERVLQSQQLIHLKPRQGVCRRILLPVRKPRKAAAHRSESGRSSVKATSRRSGTTLGLAS